MVIQEVKDSANGTDWKNIGESANNQQSGGPTVKKRLPKRIRHIPEDYFLPRRSMPSAIAFYGAWIVAGIGAGMLTEIWINKKVEGRNSTFNLLVIKRMEA